MRIARHVGRKRRRASWRGREPRGASSPPRPRRRPCGRDRARVPTEPMAARAGLPPVDRGKGPLDRSPASGAADRLPPVNAPEVHPRERCLRSRLGEDHRGGSGEAMSVHRGNTWSALGVLGSVRRCAIIVRHEGRCAWCYDDLKKTSCEIDHVIPRSRGGLSEDNNMVPACSACNLSRPEGARVPEAILQEPLDLAAGRELAHVWYPWTADRAERSAEAKRAVRRAAPRGGGVRAERAAIRSADGGDISFDTLTL